jgi:hypothetical protein
MTSPNKAYLYMALSLSILGFVLGFLDPPRGVLWGSITGVLMVITSLIEGALGLVRHNLWGIEVLVYAFFTLPAIVGGFMGSLTSWLLSHRN